MVSIFFGDASLAGKDIDPEQILTEDPDLIVKIYAGKNVIGNSGVFTAPPQEEFAEKADGNAEASRLEGFKGC